MYKLHLLPKCRPLLKVAYKALADRLAPLAKCAWILCLSPSGFDYHLTSRETEFSLHKGQWITTLLSL